MKTVEELTLEVPECLRDKVEPAIQEIKKSADVRLWFSCEYNCEDNLCTALLPFTEEIFSGPAIDYLMEVEESEGDTPQEVHDAYKWLNTLWYSDDHSTGRRGEWLLTFNRAVVRRLREELS